MNYDRSDDHPNPVQQQNYRPRSPDLSGFQAPPPPRLNRLPSIPNADSSYPPVQGYAASPRVSYDASQYFSPQASHQLSYFGSQQPAYHQSSPSQQPHYPVGQASQQQYFAEPSVYSQNDMARLRSRPQVNYNDDAYPNNEFNERIASQRVPPQPQPIMSAQREPPLQQLPQAQPIGPSIPVQPQHIPHFQVDVKTKFPVARIKRIMQTDEDIGKVAQATPTAVAKALEQFMIALVSKGAGNAKGQGSKRVTATHLKHALLADPQYDFLKEICESTPDESAKKTRIKSDAKSEADSDDEDIVSAAAPKKRKAGKRKKTDDSD